jgi:hypothetical protein
MPTFTTSQTTDIGKVRLLITDLDSTNPIFPDDEQIQTFLDLENDVIKLAAALAYETIAGNRALTMQVIQLLDLKMDGRQTAEAMLKLAKQWRDDVADADDADWAGFDIAQVVGDSVFAYRDYMARLLEAEAAL